MKEALLMTMGKGVTPDFQNTDFASLEALLRARGPHSSEAVIKAAWWSYGLFKKQKQKKRKQNKTTPSLSFLQLKEKLRDGTASSGDTHG